LDLDSIRDRLNGISEPFTDEKELLSTLYTMVNQYRGILTVRISKNDFLICVSYHVMLYVMVQNFGFFSLTVHIKCKSLTNLNGKWKYW
jgi:hypothetical protein